MTKPIIVVKMPCNISKNYVKLTKQMFHRIFWLPTLSRDISTADIKFTSIFVKYCSISSYLELLLFQFGHN